MGITQGRARPLKDIFVSWFKLLATTVFQDLRENQEDQSLYSNFLNILLNI